ncbi:hypothetical protein C8F04DRAFT_1360484 [Mycena alexandri]|uniref:Uncharacterized protein n=1 Tax=Mycena alexandri TaxID=1745969 RepID=A0AAD6SPQ7_9AGAR|nr:hypothetical protein C8F04DRAFT_1360484 [Mycena alexandri]
MPSGRSWGFGSSVSFGLLLNAWEFFTKALEVPLTQGLGIHQTRPQGLEDDHCQEVGVRKIPDINLRSADDSSDSASPGMTQPSAQPNGSSRPQLAPIFVPHHFTSHFPSPSSIGTPDSGYHSAFTPGSSTHPQFSPISPLYQRSNLKRAHAAEPELPTLVYLSDEEDSDDDEDDADVQAVGAARLLSLYKAGHVKAEHRVNKCWRLQCNRCNTWVNTSIPERTPLSSSGQFSGLESHQSGGKCTYSPKYRVRAATAPPDPQTVLTDAMDVDEDDFDFQYGRSSSLPPEDTLACPPTPETQVTDTISPPPSPFSCRGVVVDWNIEAGPPGWTFPWHRVIQRGASETQTESFRIEIDGAEVTRAFSKKCLGGIEACTECQKVPRRILELQDLAKDTKPHTNLRFLNYQQLTTRVEDKDTEIRKLRLRCVNLAKKLGNSIKKLTDFRRLAFVVAKSNIPRLKQFLSIGLRNGASTRKLVNMLGDAIEGNIPNPRPSTDSRTMDVTLMTYILGGRKLLYALSHANGLPSLRTPRNHMAFTCIMPTIGTLSIADILHNIQAVVLGPRAAAGRTTLRGVNLMIDEVALEERVVHFRHVNSVGGLCWRHSSVVNLVLSTYQSALDLVTSLKEGKVHFTKEMTVIAASCFGESGTYPILALPTCKHVNAPDSRNIYDVVMEAWRSSGAQEKVGRIWSWATDGDSIRRVAGYKAFLMQKLSYTSKSRIYGICTLLRSPAGMAVNNGRIINPTMLARYLIRLPDQDTASVHDLLFPNDAQDVPRAVKLLLGVITLGDLDYGAADPNTCTDIDALRLLAAITSLATFSHLSFTLFRSSRLQYMSNQLYGDSQTMVKNAMFCLAKQQELDPTAPFYLFQVGDDPLERLFGKLRMLGGHNSVMNCLQAIDRLGHACDLQGAFMRNPDLEQGERRLSMSRSEGVDHLTMKSWTADLTAGSCHKAAAWNAGRDIAIGIFEKTAVPREHYDYETLFADEDVDMLRPWRGGKYPGIEGDVDRSMVVPMPTVAPPSTAVETPLTAVPTTSITVTTPSPAVATPSPAVSTLPTTVPTPSAASAPPLQSEPKIQDPTEDESEDNQGDGVSFEESLPADVAPELELPSGPGITPSNYLNVNGKWVHKQRICRLVISKDFEPKSIVRLLRVRSHTNVNAKPRDDTNIDPAVLLGPNTFVVGDPELTLLRTDTKVSLAVLRTTAIHQDGVSRSSILTSTIQNPAAKVKISGQILSMTLARKTAASDFPDQPPTNATICSVDWLESDNDSEWGWIWNGVATDKVVLVSVPGLMTELVNPTTVDASIRLGEQTASRINSLGKSWEIDDKQMGIVCELLWGRAVENKITPSSIAGVKTSNVFPYVFNDGNPALLSQIPTQQLTQEHGEKVNRVSHSSETPYLAGSAVNRDTPHATYICWSKQNRQQSKRIVAWPCRQVRMGRTRIGLHTLPQRSHNLRSMSEHFDGGNPSAAQPAQWRYNMEEHLAIAHLEYASPRNPDAQQHLPHVVWTSMATTEAEERALGIPDSKIPAPFARVAGPDEGVDEPSQQLGVQRRATVRRAPVGAAPKRRKTNSGAAVPVASGPGSKN